MKIAEISIRNFKGFEQENFQFKSQFTVAIGNNGLGKSTLLQALQVGLGAFLQSMPLLPASSPYRRQYQPNERLVKYNAERKDFLPKLETPLIQINAFWLDYANQKNTLTWKREYTRSNATTHKKEHSKEIINFANYLYENHTDKHLNLAYPVLAYYSIGRTNAQIKKIDKSWKKLSKLAKGYHSALKDSVDFTGVHEWLSSYDKNIKDNIEFAGTKEAMFNAIKIAIPYIIEIDYNTDYKEFELIIDFKDRQPIERKLASMLSDGTQAMLNIVAEISYRCVMLNGKFGEKAVEKSTGIVLIDELDMHLHPNWQRHVVSDLKNAFPKIQFIVTTHSPFIVQSIESNELIDLDRLDSDTVSPNKLPINKVITDIIHVKNIQSDDFNNRYIKAKTEIEKIENIRGTLTLDDYQKVSNLLGEILQTETNDPVYKAYLEETNNKENETDK